MLAPVIHIDPALIDTDAWYTVLDDIHFTRCHGPDSARFLQGQLSCNLQKLTVAHSLRGVLCNLKGRVITDLVVVSDPDDILLLTWHNMHSAMVSVLNKYRVFFKTALEPAGNRFLAIGLGGPACHSLAADAGITLPSETDQTIQHNGLKLIALPNSELNTSPRFLCVADLQNAEACRLLEILRSRFSVLPESLWRLADIRSGMVHIRPEQSEVFTPQLLNYDINGTIDFRKGCYTGQEIVARMHYKAEAKRRLHHIRLQTETSLQSVIHEYDVELVNKITLTDGSIEALVIINEKSLPAVASQAFLTSFSVVHSQ